jgi:alanine dehydrogenase
MNIGVLKETARCERRVALTPVAVGRLTQSGQRVFVERGAGQSSHFSEESYTAAGGEILFSPAEVIDRCELLVKVGRLTPEELERLHSHQAVMAWFHLAVAEREQIEILLDKRVAAIGYEIIETPEGTLPVLEPMSEIAGQMAIAVAAHLLRSTSGGRGILLGGAPGIEPARVVILGAGVVGTSAARTAQSNGALTLVLDNDLRKLRRLHAAVPTAITGMSDAGTVQDAVLAADVLIGAVLIPGRCAPQLVSRGTVEKMKRGSVIVDVCIDQGGCVETSRPTTLADPVFAHHGVLHYCVPNMTADIARTASAALSQASLRYILQLAENGIENGLKRSPELARGVYTLWGECTHETLAQRWGLKHRAVEAMVGETIRS